MIRLTVQKLLDTAINKKMDARKSRERFELALIKHYNLKDEEINELDSIIDVFQSEIKDLDIIEEEIKLLRKRKS